MPAAVNLRASVAVWGATRLRQAAVPPMATSPSISTRSLIAIGTPCSGPMAWPARIALSAASAASLALVALIETNACSLGSRRSMRARYSSTRSTGDKRRAAISADRVWTGRNAIDVMARIPSWSSGSGLIDEDHSRTSRRQQTMTHGTMAATPDDLFALFDRLAIEHSTIEH